MRRLSHLRAKSPQLILQTTRRHMRLVAALSHQVDIPQVIQPVRTATAAVQHIRARSLAIYRAILRLEKEWRAFGVTMCRRRQDTRQSAHRIRVTELVGRYLKKIAGDFGTTASQLWEANTRVMIYTLQVSNEERGVLEGFKSHSMIPGLGGRRFRMFIFNREECAIRTWEVLTEAVVVQKSNQCTIARVLLVYHDIRT
ncbi:hypothetical protein B0O99DRAFT_171300 [Bisporella sp. PMI_857]|nr:hypothetical protein B0O99DRAFT_171300 [Bisporella sp. PMI_857]